MRLHLLFTFGFFLFFFFVFTESVSFVPSIRETWIWNKEGAFGSSKAKVGEDPIESINGYKLGKSFYSFSKGRFFDTEEKFLIDYALLGDGYLLYEKIGDEVLYFSNSGELFWKKPINSYPRSGFFSSPVLYLAGDNNSVFVLDESGNLVENGLLSGRFLTDYLFTTNNTGALVLFSGGEFIRLDEKGQKKLSVSLLPKLKNTFFKSLSVSPNGKSFGVHYSVGKEDWITVFDEEGEEDFSFSLDAVYPHKIYFSMSNQGQLLINLPDKVYFYQGKKKVWEKVKPKSHSIFQVSFSLPGVFIYTFEGNLVFLSESGAELRSKKIQATEFPIRVFPGKAAGTFYLETKIDLYQYQIF